MACDGIVKTSGLTGWSVVADEACEIGQHGIISTQTDDFGHTFGRNRTRSVYFLQSTDGLSVLIFWKDRTIRVVGRDANVSDGNVGHFIQDQLTPRIRAHQGEFVLHAGMVAHGGPDAGTPAVVIAGPTGHGKSTLTAALDSLGWPLQGDDAVAVERHGGGVQATVVTRRLSLLPDSLAHLMPACRLDASASNVKQRVPLTPLATPPVSYPVPAIFILAPPSETLRIKKMSPSEACMALVANSFTLDPTDKAHALLRFRQAAEIARTIPVLELNYPRDYALLPEIQQMMANALETDLQPAQSGQEMK